MVGLNVEVSSVRWWWSDKNSRSNFTSSGFANLNFIELSSANRARISLLSPFFQTCIMKNMLTGLNNGNKLLFVGSAGLWFW